MTSIAAVSAEQNARLLCELKETWKAIDLGAISGFCEVEPDWQCPCCTRNKRQIVRLDKNGNLLCPIVIHHDHFTDCVADRFNGKDFEFRAVRAVENSFERFSPVHICQDCNVAEPAAKVIVNAPRQFSFAPHEIAGFIRIKRNAPHEVDPEQAKVIYAALKPSMQLLAMRLRAIGATVDTTSNDAWEPASAAAWRVLKTVRRDAKDAAE